MTNIKRIKASDAYSQYSPFLGKRVPFKDAFPEMEDIKVETAESDSYEPIDFDKLDLFEYNHNIFGIDDIQPVVDCHNEFCVKGGIYLDEIMREMVQKKQTHIEDSKSCAGREGSPKGRRLYRSCSHFFYYRITIKYKSS
jgi:hypothetical protein